MADASYPTELLYHPEHDWARIDDGTAVFGITWFAQDALGEVVFFDPPEVGSTVTAGESYAEVESVKAVSDVVAPLTGEIIEVNLGLGDTPENINNDPYGDGWMVKVKLSDPRRPKACSTPAPTRRRSPESRRTLLTQYTAVTDADLAEMLSAIGVSSVQELFDRQIPADVRLGRALDLPAGLPEQEVYGHLRELARKNVSAEDEITFLGAGMYDHYVPAVIDMLLGRSEFLTPYTPYQPEVSQGNLQAMFEYQTAISELTGLPVSNASVYEGPSAPWRLPGTWRGWPTASRSSSCRAGCTRTRARRWRPTRTASARRSSRCR